MATDPKLTKYPDWPPDTHKPAVSHTSTQTFQACQRRWALTYLTEFLPRKEMWNAKREKTLMSVNALAGSIFHDTVDYALRTYAATGVQPDNLMRKAKEIARGYEDYSLIWSEAVHNGSSWTPRSAYRPVDIVYYSRELPIAIKRDIVSGLEKWIPYFEDFARGEEFMDGRYEIRTPQKNAAVPWFWSGDVPVYANYDVAFVEDGQVHIIDWKTGSRDHGENTAAEQLLCYAAFAASHWNHAYETITCSSVWVNDGNTSTKEVSVDRLTRLEQRWSAQHALQMERTAVVKQDPSQLAAFFPLCDDISICRSCVFRTCVGRDRLPSADVASDESAWRSDF